MWPRCNALPMLTVTMCSFSRLVKPRLSLASKAKKRQNNRVQSQLTTK